MNAIPDVFRPILLRSGSRYRALERHVFSSEEKAWVCGQLSSARRVHRSRLRLLATFALRHSLPPEGLFEWLEEFKTGEPLLPSTCGDAVPTVYVDNLACAAINQFMSSRGADEGDEEFKARFREFVVEQVAAAGDRREAVAFSMSLLVGGGDGRR